MERCTLNEFIEELYYCAQFLITHKNDDYLIEGYGDQGKYYLKCIYIGERNDIADETIVSNTNVSKCVEEFLKAKIIKGLTLYEAEKDIIVWSS